MAGNQPGVGTLAVIRYNICPKQAICRLGGIAESRVPGRHPSCDKNRRKLEQGDFHLDTTEEFELIGPANRANHAPDTTIFNEESP